MPYTNVNNLHYNHGTILLYKDNIAIFQLYHGENKLIFNEMMRMCFALDQHIILIPSQPVFALSS